MIPRRVFQGRASFHPVHSLLGGLFRHWIDDEHRAESWYLIAASTAAVAGAVGVMAVTSIWEASDVQDEPIWFWPWGIYGVLLAGCLAGVAPRVQVSTDIKGVKVRQGRRNMEVGWESITRVQLLAALDYHRRYALRADTDRFISSIPPDVLMITLEDRHLAIGISPDAHTELNALIHTRITGTALTDSDAL